MNISLKSSFRAGVFALAGLLVSCAPDAGVSPENDLSVSRKTIALAAPNLADTSDVSLICGCPFNLTVVKHEGDTAMIHYSIPRLSLGQAVNLYDVIIEGKADAPTGTYSSKLILKGGSEGFLDTITTTYIVP
jgi:hypothetical protein